MGPRDPDVGRSAPLMLVGAVAMTPEMGSISAEAAARLATVETQLATLLQSHGETRALIKEVLDRHRHTEDRVLVLEQSTAAQWKRVDELCTAIAKLTEISSAHDKIITANSQRLTSLGKALPILIGLGSGGALLGVKELVPVIMHLIGMG